MPKVERVNTEIITLRVDRQLLEWLDSQNSDRSSVIRKAIASYQNKQQQTGYARMLRDRTKPS
jgi:Arc/MetJ-type ribon-helix-helix transcriptional regulator